MKGIMFNEHFGLESAVLSGRKTMTRRVIKKAPTNSEFMWFTEGMEREYDPIAAHFHIQNNRFYEAKVPYRIGEIVAIKQSYFDIINNIEGSAIEFINKVDEAHNLTTGTESAGHWNKMFVKNDLMPHQIKITNIRVERLQDINEEDCLKEGVSIENDGYSDFPPFCLDKCNDLFHTAQDAFASLFDKVSGKGTWESNPFVWVIEFELVKGGNQ